MVRQLDLLGFSTDGGDEASLAQLRTQIPSTVRFGADDWCVPQWGELVWKGERSAEDLELVGLQEYAKSYRFDTVRLGGGIEALSEQTLRRYTGQLPRDFRCVVQAPALVTAPRLTRAGGFDVAHLQANRWFLDPDWFQSKVWRPASTTLNEKLGRVLLTFPSELKSAGIAPEAFAFRLQKFMEPLPEHLPIAVEIREPSYLTLDYARVLARFSAAHVFNSAPGMPSFDEQARWAPSSREVIFRVTDPVETQYPSDSQRRRAIVDTILAAPRREALVLIGDGAEASAPETIDRLIETFARKGQRPEDLP